MRFIDRKFLQVFVPALGLLLGAAGISTAPIPRAPVRRLLPVSAVSGGIHGTYATSFSALENPISERGRWVNGGADGLDWCDVRTTPGLAFGTQSGRRKYDDSVALLSGRWGPDQAIEAQVHSVRQNQNLYEEVELILRGSISAHRSTAYEVNFRCLKTEEAYTQIVRWNGPKKRFTYLNTASGPRFGVSDGDVVRATIVGSRISAYINGRLVLRAFDTTYSAGSPGMGFYLESGTGMNADYGFARFAATDGNSN